MSVLHGALRKLRNFPGETSQNLILEDLKPKAIAFKTDLSQWAGKGFWAFSDKGLFALSNFLANVLLANWLTYKDYGAFSVAFAMFLLIGALHMTLISEPMLVFGPQKYKEVLPEYLGILFYGHWCISCLFSVLIFGLAFIMHIFGQPSLSSVFSALGFAGPFILFQWFMRRVPYLNSHPRQAAIAGSIYMFIMFLGLLGLYSLEKLSTESALGVMAFGSFLSVYWMYKNRINTRISSLRQAEVFSSIIVDHINYGRWAISTVFLRWIPSNLFFVALPMWGGLESSAALRALLNFLAPLQNFILAMSDLLLPKFSRMSGKSDIALLINKILFISIFLAGLYWLSLGIFGNVFMNWVYQGGYTQYSELLWIVGLTPLFSSVIAILGTYLRSVQKPRMVFFAYLWATFFLLPMSIGLLSKWTLLGASIAIPLGSAMTAIGLIFYYLKERA